MNLPKAIRKLAKLPLTVPLQIGFIRRRVAFELKYRWFRDLEIAIPLSNGFYCPISVIDSVHSFSEIFVNNEYGSFLQKMPLPKRWIDLGCHAGHFTLYLALQHAENGDGNWQALLVDADPRMEEIVQSTLKLNQLQDRCVMLSGLISRERGEHDFAMRAATVSSANLSMGGVERIHRVRVIPPGELLSAFPPPYDLLKVDIEGGEYDFLEAYPDVYTSASWILIEWHSPDRDGSGEQRLRAMLQSRGFSIVKTLQPRRAIELDGQCLAFGVQLYRGPGQ